MNAERESERGGETATPTKSDRVAITDGTVDQWRVIHRFGSEVARNRSTKLRRKAAHHIDQWLIRKEAKHLLRQPLARAQQQQAPE